MAFIREVRNKQGVAYKVDVRIKGHPPQYGTFDRRSDAVRWGEDVEHAIRNNLPLPGEELPLDDMSIAEAVSEYLLIMQNRKGRSRHTIATDNGTGERLIKRFGSLSLRTLTREDIEDYRDDRLDQVGPSSVRQDLSMLNRIYETARIKWRFKDLEHPGKDVPLPAPPPNRKKILHTTQFERFFQECRASKNPLLYPLVYLMLNTGMRPEEAVRLRWRSIDFKTAIIDLTKTKTEPRTIPVAPSCLAYFEELYGDDKLPGDLIFITEEIAAKRQPVRYFRRAFEQACIRAGINRPKKRDVSKKKAAEIEDGEIDSANVTLYTLRHSAATYLLMNGADIRTVADILGHKNISQTMKYTHMVHEHKMKAVSNPDLPWNR